MGDVIRITPEANLAEVLGGLEPGKHDVILESAHHVYELVPVRNVLVYPTVERVSLTTNTNETWRGSIWIK